MSPFELNENNFPKQPDRPAIPPMERRFFLYGVAASIVIGAGIPELGHLLHPSPANSAPTPVDQQP